MAKVGGERGGIRKLRRSALRGAQALLGRLRYLRKAKHRFHGLFASREEAIRSVLGEKPVGYDNDSIVDVSFDRMCEIAPWDYPVLYWLERAISDGGRVLDLGGHMGTKFRAFGRHLRLADRGVEWTVYDVPAIVRAGRARARSEGLANLSFIDRLAEAGEADVVLASGLLQYLDITFPECLGQLPEMPSRLIVNKVAVWEHPSAYTLENFGSAYVPYQIRNRALFLDEIAGMGYRIEDEWKTPSLSHRIPTHPHYGHSESLGFFLIRS